VYQVGNEDKINYTEMHGQQNIKILFYVHEDMFWSLDHHQAVFTKHAVPVISCARVAPKLNF